MCWDTALLPKYPQARQEGRRALQLTLHEENSGEVFPENPSFKISEIVTGSLPLNGQFEYSCWNIRSMLRARA